MGSNRRVQKGRGGRGGRRNDLKGREGHLFRPEETMNGKLFPTSSPLGSHPQEPHLLQKHPAIHKKKRKWEIKLKHLVFSSSDFFRLFFSFLVIYSTNDSQLFLMSSDHTRHFSLPPHSLHFSDAPRSPRSRCPR